MYIAIVPNRNSPPAILLRESYREEGKVKTRTLANLSMLPPQAVEVLRRTLKGEELVAARDAFEIVEGGSRFHGHIAHQPAWHCSYLTRAWTLIKPFAATRI